MNFCNLPHIQGYPLRMRLQRRLYEIYTISISLYSQFPATEGLFVSLPNPLNKSLDYYI